MTRHSGARTTGRLWPLGALLCLTLAAPPSVDARSLLAVRADERQNSLRPYAGMTLIDALRRLQQSGLRIVFSTRILRPDMRVQVEPISSEPRKVLVELLAPHGLGVADGPGGVLVVVSLPGSPRAGGLRGVVQAASDAPALAGVTVRVVEAGVEAVSDARGRFEFSALKPGAYTVEGRRQGFSTARARAVVQAGDTADVVLVLQPAWSEEVAVQPSRISLLVDEPPASVSLSREEIEALPHLGEDVFRTLSLLPGTTSTDLSAQFHIRGGRGDELLVLLDGQEIYEPYHLRDFDNALSIVAASTLERVNLTTAAFPVSQGDRMAGVLNMTTLAPQGGPRIRLGIAVHGVQLETAGTLADGKLGWLASVRRGNTDLIGRLFDFEDPSFWDSFGKVEYQPTTGQSLRLHGLVSQDVFDFTLQDEPKRLKTEYGSSYLWLSHRAVPASDLFVDTTASLSRGERDRRGGEADEERSFEVRDQRDLQVAGLLQSWTLQAGPRHSIAAGVEYRTFEAHYDYSSVREFSTPLGSVRAEPREGAFAFDGRLRSEHLGVYASDRIRPVPTATIEVGLRYDRQTVNDERLVSPRLSAAWGLGAGSVLRVGWGRFAQSQRPYELMVEDGDPRPYRAERSEHWVVGFERLFAPAFSLPLRSVRAEVYRRTVANPRPRYENLLAAYDPFPEGDFDRIRVEPDSAMARGLELLVHGRATSRFGWWLNYAWAKTEDRVEGKDRPRRFDQPHTLNLDVNYRLGSHWNVNLAWLYRTGWPTTSLTLESQGPDEEGTLVLGEVNGERLPDYHRLDLRLSRSWETLRGTFRFFFDAHNAYGRRNVSGLDVQYVDATKDLRIRPEYWPRFYASAGVVWEFP